METITGTDFHYAAQLLLQDEVVAIPTETVYGLAGNALSEKAVSTIFDVKNRPRFNPLIMHLASVADISRYATISATALKVAQHFMPGPLSLLLPKKDNVPLLLTAGSDKVVVRIPNHPMTLELLRQLPFPLAAPSANPFGYISPTTAAHVAQNLHGRIPYILDGGPCTVGVESTIVEVTDQEIILHRPGGLAVEAIHQLTGLPVLKAAATVKPQTSGNLKSHYAPGTPLYLGNIEALYAAHAGKRTAIISFYRDYHHLPGTTSYPLSPGKDLRVAAAALFRVLRETDSGHYDAILVEQFPNEGLGIAINDRLQRAQHLHK